jgi:hypothetical protein
MVSSRNVPWKTFRRTFVTMSLLLGTERRIANSQIWWDNSCLQQNVLFKLLVWVSSFHRRETCQSVKRCSRFKSSYRTCTSELYRQLSSVDINGLVWSGPSCCIFLLYNLGSNLLENMYCCRFYLATDYISKNSISVDTCLLSRCLAAEGS